MLYRGLMALVRQRRGLTHIEIIAATYKVALS